MQQLDLVNNFFALNENLVIDPAAYASVLHPEAEQIEYPSLVNKLTQRRSFQQIIDNVRDGRELLTDVHFDIQKTHPGPDHTLVVETKWRATATMDIGLMMQGHRLLGHFCMIFEFKDEMISQIRCYYNFEFE